MADRFLEIDFFRGTAIILMVFFNWSFTLQYLGVYRISEGWVFWWLFPRAIASMFIFISGVSLTLMRSKYGFGKFAKRGTKLFLLGLLITAFTYAFATRDTIYFGILHFIGVATITGYFFTKLDKKAVLISAIAVMGIGAILEGFLFDFPWLLWLGFVPYNFSTLDYFPVFPWFSITLLGIFFGKELYKDGKRLFVVDEKKSAAPVALLGRHSLLIYIIHQPVLLAILYFSGLL